ncbi:uncharacterized protein LOC111046443 [Nilaparvata lugens]|uniref:uncharacterized protein LOC111046443 n=1 Tax=Nilaparvata lugens TaxID=108931 RepID=UPI00193E01A8|nr:uncharacterized protein LOC111046443 [Nilaparvata lugens]
MGVEDRANSFEYLPGHMYRPDDASGRESSSISLNRNASSHNELTDEADKSWDVSNSSTFARDIERGVDMMLNFVQSSQVKSSELKKKLMKRVAEKLISTDISSGCHKMDSKNPSSIGSNSLSEERLGEHRNGRETRRGDVKDIHCQESPFTSERTSSRTSSECFKPKSSFSSAKKHAIKDVLDKCVGTERSTQSSSDSNGPRRIFGSVGVQCESISSNEVSKLYLEKSSAKYHDNKECSDFQKQPTNSGKKSDRRLRTPESSITIDSNRSSPVDNSSDWKPSMPIPTRVFEQKRKFQAGNTRTDDNVNTKAMIDLLSFERDNQRLMIQSEIEHLDYLRRLLQKQEELRDSLAKIQKTRQKHLDSRYNKCKTANESNKQVLNSIKSRLKQYSESNHRRNSNTEEEHQEWDSHNYCSSVDEMNKPISNKVHRNNSISVSQEQRNNDGTIKTKKSQDSRRVDDCQRSKNDDNFVDTRSNGESSEILASKPVTSDNQQSTKSQSRRSSKSSALEPDCPVCHSKKIQSCKCSRNNPSLEKNKKPLAYFITFEDGSSENNSSVGAENSLEEIKLKSNRSNDRVSNVTNVKKKETSAVEKENREPKQPKKNHEWRPTLQEYLVMNRGEYVNRAEYRRKCVAELTYLRELRNKTKRHLIVMAPESSDYSQSTTPRELPPPPLAMKRVFSQRTMRRQTERKYRQLAEVKNRNIDLKRKEAYRTNRLMAEVFTKKLQKRVLNGETNLSNSVSVISSL